MPVQRIITDIPPDEVPFVRAMINQDGGIVKQQTTHNGRVTIVAVFDAADAPPALPAANSAASKWMDIARAELGVEEVGGAGSNPRIEEYLGTTTLGAQSDDVPWCSAFVNFCVTRAGVPGTNSALARSWLGWGVETPALVPGCIGVLARGEPPRGHVGFFCGLDQGRVLLLGGNQGDRVSLASFDAARVIGRRLPA
jgi:uncharacterized protein (TIGR02594 family)